MNNKQDKKGIIVEVKIIRSNVVNKNTAIIMKPVPESLDSIKLPADLLQMMCGDDKYE